MSTCRVRYESYQTQTSSHCFLSCALQAAKVNAFVPQTVDGLTRSVTAQFLSSGEEQLATVVTNAIYSCLNTQSSGNLMTKMRQSNEFICDPNALLTKGCINILIAANCPVHRQLNQNGCAEWRQYWQRCKPQNIL